MQALKACVQPLHHFRLKKTARMPGIEPGRADWRPANVASGATVLPLHYIRNSLKLARVSGIEPDPADWKPAFIAPKAIVLPLHYTHI